MKIVSTEAKVAGHYTRGGLEQTILQAMAKAGKDAARLTIEDFAPVDEFHVGGIEATIILIDLDSSNDPDARALKRG